MLLFSDGMESFMNKEKMMQDIIAMLDNSVKNGEGHINVKVDEMQKDEKEVSKGCADCSVNPMACSIPTIELPGDEDFQK